MAFFRNRAPELFSGGELNREETTARFWIWLQAFRARYETDVGYRGVGGFRIRGRTPLDAAEDASLAELLLPDDLALIIGIERMQHSGFLTGDEQALAVRAG